MGAGPGTFAGTGGRGVSFTGVGAGSRLATGISAGAGAGTGTGMGMGTGVEVVAGTDGADFNGNWATGSPRPRIQAHAPPQHPGEPGPEAVAVTGVGVDAAGRQTQVQAP